MLKVGDEAPEFSLPSDEGDTVKLSDFRGKKVVLYFYPKDDTSGCTIEACELRDRDPDIAEQGAAVLGVSPDGVESHRKFKGKYDLPFKLLADEDHSVADAYGAWGEKKMYGRAYQGVLRKTFIIDEEGKIARVFEKVKPRGHGDEVLEAVSS